MQHRKMILILVDIFELITSKKIYINRVNLHEFEKETSKD